MDTITGKAVAGMEIEMVTLITCSNISAGMDLCQPRKKRYYGQEIISNTLLQN